MNISNFLRKIGLLRSGSTTFSGKVSGEGSVSDILDNTQKKIKDGKVVSSKKSTNIFVLIIGLLFALLGFLILLVSFWGGFFLLCMSSLMIPFSNNRLSKKLPFLTVKRNRIILYIILGFLFFISLGSSAEFTNNIKDGGDDPETVLLFSNELGDVLTAYQIAQISTAASFQIEYGSLTDQEYYGLLEVTKEAWQELEKELKDLEQFEGTLSKTMEPTETAYLFDRFIESVHAQTPMDLVGMVPASDLEGYEKGSKYDMYSFPSSVEDREIKQLDADRWNHVSVEKNRLPSERILELVQKHFGVTASTALTMLEEHQSGITEYWNDEAEFNKRMAHGALVIESGSSVLLLVGGTVISGGTVAAASMSAKIALGASTLVSGVEVGLQVQETGITVMGGTEEDLKHVVAVKNALYPIFFLNKLAQVPTNVQDLKELGFTTVFSLGKDVYDGNIKINTENDTYSYYNESQYTGVQNQKGELEVLNQMVPSHLQLANPLVRAQEAGQVIDPLKPYIPSVAPVRTYTPKKVTPTVTPLPTVDPVPYVVPPPTSNRTYTTFDECISAGIHTRAQCEYSFHGMY